MQTFNNCINITNINFNGTKEQWQAINKATTWNKNTGDYTVTFSDGSTLSKNEDI